MKQQHKQALGSGVLLLIMVLSVVGFSYTPDRSQSGGGTLDSRDEVVVDGQTYTFDEQARMYTTVVEGQRIYAHSPPDDVQRLGFSLPLPVETIYIDVAGQASEQQRFVQSRLQQDLSGRLPVPVRMGQGDCQNSSSLTITIEGSEQLVQDEGSCYSTGITDASILILADYMVYSFYDIL